MGGTGECVVMYAPISVFRILLVLRGGGDGMGGMGECVV
jgi:hypothetical protein